MLSLVYNQFVERTNNLSGVLPIKSLVKKKKNAVTPLFVCCEAAWYSMSPRRKHCPNLWLSNTYHCLLWLWNLTHMQKGAQTNILLTNNPKVNPGVTTTLNRGRLATLPGARPLSLPHPTPRSNHHPLFLNNHDFALLLVIAPTCALLKGQG